MRRFNLLVILLIVAGLMVAACTGVQPTAESTTGDSAETDAAMEKSEAAEAEEAVAETDTEAATDMSDENIKEAPALHEMVMAGDLPPLEERLPKEPLVVEPTESIGKYGGTWHRAFKGVKDYHAWARLNYDPVLRWAPDPGGPVLPGLAKEWEWNDEGTELTLHFREGLKWSDGEPWTVDDILFWWENIELDTNITPSPHIEWTVDGEPMELEKVDDYTIIFKFPGPTGVVETMGMAFHGHQWPLGFERFGVFAPKHYLEQFHPALNDDIEDYAKFEEMAFDYNVERPVIWAWKPTQWEPGGTEMILERNPYYWKVDPEGNQLPYIDRIHMSLVEDNEAINLMAASGDLDMQYRNVQISKLPVLKENEEAGNYHVSFWGSPGASGVALQPNQSYGDPVYRALMQNRDFRYALSMAIDRDLINDIAYLGQATPTGQSVAPSSGWHVPEKAMFMAEFEPDKSKELLEGIGLQMGDDGFYNFEDGSDINLIVESQCLAGDCLDALELVVEQWNDIGLNTTLKTMNRDLFWPRAIGNEVMIPDWATGSIFPLMNPDNLLAFNEKSFWAPQFGVWYQTNGASGEEPPDYIKEGQEIYSQILKTTDFEEQNRLGQELVNNATENMWTINIAGQVPAPVVVKNNFKNVREGTDYTASWVVMTPGNQNPATYYFDDE